MDGRAQTFRSRRAESGNSPAAPPIAIRAAGVLALVLVFAVGPAAASSREAAGADAAPPKLIRLVSTTVSMRVLVDKPPRGTSKGDTIFTANVLTNAVPQFGQASRAVVGSDAGRTTNLDAVPMTADVLVRLPGGTLQVRGRIRIVGQTRVSPVVSGTGKFKGAKGTLTAKAISGSPDLSNIYRLSY